MKLRASGFSVVVAMGLTFVGGEASAQTLTSTNIGNACSYGGILFAQWNQPTISAALNASGTEIVFSITDGNTIGVNYQREYEVFVSANYQVNLIPGSFICLAYLEPDTSISLSAADPTWKFSLSRGQTTDSFSIPYQPSLAGQTVFIQAYGEVPFPAPGFVHSFVTDAAQLDF